MGPRGFRRGRRRGLIVGAAIGASAARRNSTPQDDMATQQADTPTAQSDVLGELEKLAEFRDRGILTEDEFQAQKKELLGE